MDKVNSALIMNQLVFDRIEFIRKGFKNTSELNINLQVQVGKKDDSYRVTLVLNGTKEGEYEFSISLSGFFSIDNNEVSEKQMVQDLITKNAVSILMPYLRSEVSLLTAQPNTESVVLQPMNISRMLQP